MQQIQSELPRSVALRDVLPCLADFFSPTTPARIRRSALVSLYRTVSRPFDKPETGKFAVKVINHCGDEVLKVFKI
jgi:hypothetical protein